MSTVLNIGINAALLSFSQGYRNAGVGRYIYYLLRAFAEHPVTHTFTAFASEPPPLDDPLSTSTIIFRTTRLLSPSPVRRIAYEQFVLPVSSRGLDLLHAPVNVVPLLSTIPTVVTIHDLSFMVVPERFLPAKRRYLEVFTRASAKKARHVIADSENTRQDIIRLLGVRPDKVTAIPLAVDRHFTPPDSEAIATFRRRNNLPEHFILYMGTLEPRKNLVTLVESYALARSRGLSLDLILAGGKGWMFDDIFAAVERFGLQKQVHFPGYVSYAEQPLWYGSADMFVYPSLYEGFGLPVLEAMACGTPIIASSTSSIPEVVGSAGILLDCTGPEILASEMANLASSSSDRARLRGLGLQQAAGFTWARTAASTLDVYTRAVD